MKEFFWCLSTKDYVPFWDVMLAQFLLITTDELYFKEKANKDLAGILPYFYQLEKRIEESIDYYKSDPICLDLITEIELES